MEALPELASDLLATAHYGAGSLLLAQASGGNNSVKARARDLLWIKASGRRLADVSVTHGIVALRCTALKEIIRQEAASSRSPTAVRRRQKHEEIVRLTQDAVLDARKGRPSLESGFHSLLGDVVLHLHPVYLNAFSCMEGGRELLSEIAPRQFTWVEYATPGWELALQIYRVLEATGLSQECASFVLENHGFIASGENAQQVITATEAFLTTARSFFGDLPGLFTAEPTTQAQEHATHKLHSLYRERWGDQSVAIRPARFGAFNQIESNLRLFDVPGPLVPDDVVYGCREIRRCSFNGLRDAVGSFPASPPTTLAIAVEGAGTILLARDPMLLDAMEEMLLAQILVRTLIARRGLVRTLLAAEVEYLQSMESEKYRVMVCSKGAM